MLWVLPGPRCPGGGAKGVLHARGALGGDPVLCITPGCPAGGWQDGEMLLLLITGVTCFPACTKDVQALKALGREVKI